MAKLHASETAMWLHLGGGPDARRLGLLARVSRSRSGCATPSSRRSRRAPRTSSGSSSRAACCADCCGPGSAQRSATRRPGPWRPRAPAARRRPAPARRRGSRTAAAAPRTPRPRPGRAERARGSGRGRRRRRSLDHPERLHAERARRRGPSPRSPPGSRPRMPSASASSCRQNGLRAKPPVARISRTSSPASRSERSTSASCRHTPSTRRADHVLAPVRAREPDVGAARRRAPVRRALGRAGTAASAARPPCGRRRRAPAARAGGLAEVGRERVVRPLQHHAAVVDRAADGPALGRRARSRRRGLRVDAGRSTITRSAPLVPMEHAADARPHRADAEVGERAVRRRRPRPACQRAGRARPRPPGEREDVRRRHERGQLLGPTPASSSASASQSSVARSSRPVADATERSVDPLARQRGST